MGRAEQVVVALAVLEPEDAVAVLGPAAGRLVGLAGQQRGEQQLLGADRVHLVADDVLDPAQHPQAQRQPGVDAGRGAADVAGAHAAAGGSAPRRPRGPRAGCGRTGWTYAGSCAEGYGRHAVHFDAVTVATNRAPAASPRVPDNPRPERTLHAPPVPHRRRSRRPAGRHSGGRLRAAPALAVPITTLNPGEAAARRRRHHRAPGEEDRRRRCRCGSKVKAPDRAAARQVRVGVTSSARPTGRAATARILGVNGRRGLEPAGQGEHLPDRALRRR